MFAESTQGSIIGIINNNELTSHDTAALTRLTKSIITTSDLLGQVKLAEDLWCVLQDFVHIIYSLRITLQSKVYERNLKSYYVFSWHFTARLNKYKMYDNQQN